MNIDQYRAMVAEEQQSGGEANVQTQPAPIETIEQAVQETEQVQQAPATPEVEAPQIQAPQVNELLQYQQQADELKDQLAQAQVAKEYYDKIMANPAYAKTFAENNGIKFIDPSEQKVIDMQRQYDKLLFEREVENMSIKYPDFDSRAVVQFAVDNKIQSLDDAYTLRKARSQGTEPTQNVDVATLTEQIRQSILDELKSEVSTSSLVGASGGGTKHVQTSGPELSPQEQKVARGMGITPAEYSKWKHANK